MHLIIISQQLPLNSKIRYFIETITSNNYLSNPIETSFFISPSSEQEILFIINGLNQNKTNGPHIIPSDILQMIKSNVCFPLCKIINLSFSTGIYPQKLKIAKIQSTFKEKGSLLECRHYRPISLLSNINNIFVKMMYSRLYKCLSIHECIYDLQFGFRENHSTTHALVSLTESIRQSPFYYSCTCKPY